MRLGHRPIEKNDSWGYFMRSNQIVKIIKFIFDVDDSKEIIKVVIQFYDETRITVVKKAIIGLEFTCGRNPYTLTDEKFTLPFVFSEEYFTEKYRHLYFSNFVTIEICPENKPLGITWGHVLSLNGLL